ncbi:MAG: DUF4239 domain-containing protein [Candidatus Omnitrophica bacterium]|nr:DUF4239 domain-containing protein [Candidatus Omnitrophota bacterium]
MPFTQRLLVDVPLVSLGIIIVMSSIVLSVAGLLLVRYFVPHKKLEVHNDVASAIFGTLGMAYTVLLAFVVVIVWQAFDKANVNVEKEANCVVTLYRDAESFSDTAKIQIRTALNEYAKAVIHEEWAVLARGEASPHAQELINTLHRAYSSYVPHAITDQIFFETSVNRFNELCELRRERLLDSRNGIHPVLWFVLVVGGIATIMFTFFFGSENLGAQLIMTMLLSAIIALILFTILVFDFPFSGSVNITPQAFSRVVSY